MPILKPFLSATLMLPAFFAVDASAQSDRIVISERPEAFVLTVPVSQLVMLVPRAGFIQGTAPRSDATASKRYFSLEDRSKAIFISGWFESEDGFHGMSRFWEEQTAAWSKEKVPAPASVVFKKIGGWDAVTYQIAQSSGSNSNIRAEWVAAGTWIDLHMSVASDSSAAESVRQLESLLMRIRVTEKGAATAPVASPSEAMKYVEEGSRHYVKHDYQGAIGPYAKALEIEKKQPALDKTLWRVLIDNLGMAYGITGDLKRAKATFDYGLSQDKTYPMFYYNLACTFAEMNDVEGSIANLRLAFQNKDNVNAGEHVPDPRDDDSFQRFAESERFNAALRQMGLGNR